MKMTFEEFLKAKAEYAEYIKTADEPAEEKPVEGQKSTESKGEEPSVDKKPEQQEKAPENDEIAALREEMRKLREAMSPSLGSVEPVGVEDIVNRFFEIEKK